MGESRSVRTLLPCPPFPARRYVPSLISCPFQVSILADLAVHSIPFHLSPTHRLSSHHLHNSVSVSISLLECCPWLHQYTLPTLLHSTLFYSTPGTLHRTSCSVQYINLSSPTRNRRQSHITATTTTTTYLQSAHDTQGPTSPKLRLPLVLFSFPHQSSRRRL
ncbi:hypothetical protein LY78DRAFT_205663 [Colletotrichum sublineola]|nr:hypothetical protein LY78DRAFT_205663 [Colletotrichum sublineola]